MSVETILETHVDNLLNEHLPVWFEYYHAAHGDVIRSAQNAADQTGDPQFLVDAKTRICKQMVISDTRRALAVAPGRFIRYFAEQARQEALAEQAREAHRSAAAGGAA